MATIERRLQIPEGYNAGSNPRVASFAAQLDDQTSRLRKSVEDLETRHLEWQPHPGVNTVGMLLAHLAVVDVWWTSLAPSETPDSSWEPAMREALGVGSDDDGIPLAPDGTHPASLRGKPVSFYLDLLSRARSATHQALREWRDADLATTFRLRDRVITREWVAYHVLEHFAGHFGQVLLLKHLMRDAGLLPAEERK